MPNIKAICSYEGTGYFGWQKTNIGPSIEEELERALSKILGEKILLQAASRTDRGVHAHGQVITFTCSKFSSLQKLQRSLNGLLPKDITILSLEEVSPDFHPTLDSISKEYHYDLCLGTTQLPFDRRFSWHFPYPIDLEKINLAIPYLLGKQDFSSFCNMRLFLQEEKVRTLFSIDVEALENNRIRIRVIGDHFLYKMVRNLVGTLIYIGCGKLSLQDLPLILTSKDRKTAGVTAPAHGLFLNKINYRSFH